MAIGVAESLPAKDWRRLYVAALLEGDRDKVPSLIVEAEHAIVQRARELFQAGEVNIDEEQGLDHALYCLRALKSCLVSGDFAEAA